MGEEEGEGEGETERERRRGRDGEGEGQGSCDAGTNVNQLGYDNDLYLLLDHGAVRVPLLVLGGFAEEFP